MKLYNCSNFIKLKSLQFDLIEVTEKLLRESNKEFIKNVSQPPCACICP